MTNEEKDHLRSLVVLLVAIAITMVFALLPSGRDGYVEDPEAVPHGEAK
jgi:cobalamin biosynthesis Mg chelatase CobN